MQVRCPAWLAFCLVALLVCGVLFVVDRFGAVELEEYWNICREHPGISILEFQAITRDGKVTRREMRHLRKLVETHDHRLCLEPWYPKVPR